MTSRGKMLAQLAIKQSSQRENTTSRTKDPNPVNKEEYGGLRPTRKLHYYNEESDSQTAGLNAADCGKEKWDSSSGDDLFDSDGEDEYVPNESDSSFDDMILPSQPDVSIAESPEEDDLVSGNCEVDNPLAGNEIPVTLDLNRHWPEKFGFAIQDPSDTVLPKQKKKYFQLRRIVQRRGLEMKVNGKGKKLQN